MNKISNYIYWVARLVAAIVLLQTLFYKFTAAEESVFIFTTVGMEPWGRIGVGIFELIASVMLLITPVAWMGAGISIGLMLGAIGMHLTLLGIEIQGDGGYLFFLAVLVTVCAAYVLWKDREKLDQFLKRFR
jgi:putative oxidoreductase